MKKVLFLMLLSALLLLGGCGSETLPEEKAAAPVEAQNINYTEEATTAEAPQERPIEGTPLQEGLPDVEPGDLPSPEPVETTAESAEK